MEFVGYGQLAGRLENILSHLRPAFRNHSAHGFKPRAE